MQGVLELTEKILVWRAVPSFVGGGGGALRAVMPAGGAGGVGPVGAVGVAGPVPGTGSSSEVAESAIVTTPGCDFATTAIVRLPSRKR